MDYSAFFLKANPATIPAALNLAVFGLLEDASGYTLARMCHRDLATLPTTATNLKFGAEYGLQRYRQKLLEATNWSVAQADIAAAGANAINADIDRQGLDTAEPRLAVAKRLLELTADWHPISDSPAIQLQLELFRAKLLLWLQGALDWATTQRDLMTTSHPSMTGAEYRLRRITELQESIAESEEDIAEMYLAARKDLPFLSALRDSLPGLQPTT